MFAAVAVAVAVAVGGDVDVDVGGGVETLYAAVDAEQMDRHGCDRHRCHLAPSPTSSCLELLLSREIRKRKRQKTILEIEETHLPFASQVPSQKKKCSRRLALLIVSFGGGVKNFFFLFAW